jgi:hypothetical protein
VSFPAADYRAAAPGEGRNKPLSGGNTLGKLRKEDCFKYKTALLSFGTSPCPREFFSIVSWHGTTLKERKQI